MNNPRDTVYTALWNLIKTVRCPVGSWGTSWQLQSRRFVTWDKVDSTMQPAIFMLEGPRQLQTQKETFGLPRYELSATVWAYFRIDAMDQADLTQYPGQFISPFLDNLELVITPNVGEVQTLGGLVDRVWIEGEIFIDAGINDNQAVIMVPIKISTGT